jgi:hypothetical protein
VRRATPINSIEPMAYMASWFPDLLSAIPTIVCEGAGRTGRCPQLGCPINRASACFRARRTFRARHQCQNQSVARRTRSPKQQPAACPDHQPLVRYRHADLRIFQDPDDLALPELRFRMTAPDPEQSTFGRQSIGEAYATLRSGESPVRLAALADSPEVNIGLPVGTLSCAREPTLGQGVPQRGQAVFTGAGGFSLLVQG